MEEFLLHPEDSPSLEIATDATTRLDDKVHPIAQCLRRFVKKRLPKVDKNGLPFMMKKGAVPDAKNSYSEKDRDCIPSPKLLSQCLPCNPHCSVSLGLQKGQKLTGPEVACRMTSP